MLPISLPRWLKRGTIILASTQGHGFTSLTTRQKIATTNRYVFVTAASMLTTKTRFWFWFLKLKSFVFNLHLIKLHRMARLCIL